MLLANDNMPFLKQKRGAKKQRTILLFKKMHERVVYADKKRGGSLPRLKSIRPAGA
jgi:hypothetical protein